jgi:hypothetical protein
MDADDASTEPAITTRRYTGRTRAEAAAGFQIDRPGIAGRYMLVAEAWDEATKTLTVMLKELPSHGGAGRDDRRS